MRKNKKSKRSAILKLHGTLAQREEIAARFKEYRAWAHITQQQLADLLDLDRSSISDIETAKHLPHRSTMQQFTYYEARDYSKQLATKKR